VCAANLPWLYELQSGAAIGSAEALDARYAIRDQQTPSLGRPAEMRNRRVNECDFLYLYHPVIERQQ
jgi:hypothetical protein